MLRACALDFEGKWDSYLHLVEFAYNNSYQATIQMAPYEALYGRKCRSPLHWDEVGDKAVLEPDLVQQACDKIQVVSRESRRHRTDIKAMQIEGDDPLSLK